MLATADLRYAITYLAIMAGTFAMEMRNSLQLGRKRVSILSLGGAARNARHARISRSLKDI